MSDITRSEAIKQLRLLKADIINGLSFVSKTKDKHPALDSLDMAIKSLETDEAYQLEYESSTKNDLGVDCISRKAVLDLLEDTNNGWIINEVLQLPPVTPQEPRKGHWISHREHCKQNNLLPSGLGSYFWCSECDCGVDSKVFRRVNYNYCPNCGCKME